MSLLRRPCPPALPPPTSTAKPSLSSLSTALVRAPPRVNRRVNAHTMQRATRTSESSSVCFPSRASDESRAQCRSSRQTDDGMEGIGTAHRSSGPSVGDGSSAACTTARHGPILPLEQR